MFNKKEQFSGAQLENKSPMSKCTFTGLPTENKWKNIPVHPDIIDLAREMVDEGSVATMRQAFALLTSQLNKDIKIRNQLKGVK